jgi:hypothetical protein
MHFTEDSMSFDIEKFHSYIKEAGFEHNKNLEIVIKNATELGLCVRQLSIKVLEFLRPGVFAHTRDSFYWAEQDNLDIQVSEMLGRSGYPVPWTEEEYSYY